MTNNEHPDKFQLLEAIENGATHSRVVAPGLGYPNHSDAESPNPTGWLRRHVEIESVSRETESLLGTDPA